MYSARRRGQRLVMPDGPEKKSDGCRVGHQDERGKMRGECRAAMLSAVELSRIWVGFAQR